ncbi:protein CHROMOSOME TRANSMISSION FIDELITY 7-like [Silene latifolia]|uniref:protein CHROMOSOME TRANSMISSION FIDELITY 7-like n=1 Tax=Silene latifolia TaxID=37657 RepID=UPI003D77AED8
MQKTIKSFFKHLPTCNAAPQTSNSNDLFDEIRVHELPQIRVKYTRQALDSHQSTRGKETNWGLIGDEKDKLEVGCSKGKTLNKKRSYAQFHLELGQSDFLLHTCKVCGTKYAKGEEIDEKVHATFHKNFTNGIPFKGWRHEKVIHHPLPEKEKDRVILVSNCGPPAQRKKVQEVVKMMEIELGDGWIFHDLCQVYLYVSSQRIAGCVVAESINTAHRVLLDSMDKVFYDISRKKVASKPTTLQFGEICFQREVSRKGYSHRSSDVLDSNALRPLVCEEEATPALCGIRVIWVTPSNRRKHIATHLLDAVRKSFSIDRVLEHSQLAFSQPTSTGKALAIKYAGTGSFLVYKAN